MVPANMVAEAFANTFTPMCLFLIWFGTIIGIIFGSIPGLSATMAVVLFLPLTFGMETTQGLALLCGLYMGGISGGLISAILLKIPGTPSSISTVFDGGPMAEKGEAGRALGVGILYSFLGSVLGIFALMFVSPLLAKVCLLFSAADYFAVAVFALSIIASLSGKDMLNGLIAGLIGIALSMVGMAPIDAVVRFTFGNYQLMSGFDITVLLIGVFAITDIILSGFGRDHLADKMEKKKYKLKGYGLSMTEFIQQIPNTIISALIGIGIGILPGIGGSTSGLLQPLQVSGEVRYRHHRRRHRFRVLQQRHHRRFHDPAALHGYPGQHRFRDLPWRPPGARHQPRSADLQQVRTVCLRYLPGSDHLLGLHADLRESRSAGLRKAP